MVLKRRSFCVTLGYTLLPGLAILVVTSYVRAHSGDSQNDMFSDFCALVFESWKMNLSRVVRHAHTKKRTTALVL